VRAVLARAGRNGAGTAGRVTHARRDRAGKETMTDRMPDDLGELDELIGFDMLDAALRGVAEAEQYAKARAKHEAEHGTPDPDSFPRWSQISEPGTLEYGPYQNPPTGE
jgi:hypothetical protein